MRKFVGALLLSFAASGCASSSLTTQIVGELRVLRAAQLPNVVTPTPGNSHYFYYLRLKGAIERELGIKVTEEVLEDYWGLTDHKTFIKIHTELTPNGKFETLVHEVAHVLMTDLQGKEEQQALVETVSLVVCKRLGLDTRQQSYTYLVKVLPRFAAEDVIGEHEAAVATAVDQVLQLLGEQ